LTDKIYYFTVRREKTSTSAFSSWIYVWVIKLLKD